MLPLLAPLAVLLPPLLLAPLLRAPLLRAPLLRANGPAEEQAGPRLVAETLSGLPLRNLGPAFMSGRIADVAIDPRDPSRWYVAVGSGGVWRTENAGTTWSPIFDGQGSYSIGCVTLDVNRPGTVWVGTGENVGGRHVGFGDGVYRSRDGGQSWENLGLSASEHIGKIVVDPRDSDVVYVASQGPLWTGGGERGLYKTSDGGASWERVLGGGEYTGVNDVVLDPSDSDVLYASTHQRQRTVAALINGGPESGIHKSTDGGRTWRELTNGLPQEEDMGRIGLAISPQQPEVVYATIELAGRKGGFWRSADGGESWEKRSDSISGGTGPHYYQELFASPHHFDRVYQADVFLSVTSDGGKTFEPVGEEHKHVDNHAVAFDARDPDYLLVGCDGGLYETWDLGQSWKFVANLPVTQFYKVALDDDEPFYNVYGGTQDNSTQGGPSRTDDSRGIVNSDWFIVLGGDGHQPAVEPGNPNVVYAEWQEGNLNRFDRTTGEIVYVQPQPGPDEPSERFNWDAPILVSPHSPTRLYYASQRLWRSDDRGDSWSAVSGDLTRGIQRLLEPIMGRVWSIDAVWDLWAMSKYGTITSLAESPLVEGLLYAGTDDGLVQVSEDGGSSWRSVEDLAGVAQPLFVNDLKADLFDPDTVYACIDRHKEGDFAPYVVKSTDRGHTWTQITGDLPDRHLAWRLVQDHVRPELLFLGTEHGLFFTTDTGSRWVELTGGNVPNIPFRDLAIQRREDDLVGATFGRGFWMLDDYSALREVSEEALASEALLFGVRRAHWYVERQRLGGEGAATQGAAYYRAPNPPFGALFTYYLRDELQGAAEARREREKAATDQNTPTPGWDALREEELEAAPEILLLVRDAAGTLVRRLPGPKGKGFQRVAWDLRHPAPDAWSREEHDDPWSGPPRGFLAAPGRYSVELVRHARGELVSLAAPREFDVVALREHGLASAAEPAQAAAFLTELQAVQREANAAGAALAELRERVQAIVSVLPRSGATPELDQRVHALRRELADLDLALNGSERREMAGDPGPMSIQARLWVVLFGNEHSTYGPTPTHRESLAIGRERLDRLRESLERIAQSELPALEAELGAAGLPWTPGRLPAANR